MAAELRSDMLWHLKNVFSVTLKIWQICKIRIFVLGRLEISIRVHNGTKN